MGNLTSKSKEFKNILKKRGMMSYEMGKEISDSWSRCIAKGLNPFQDPKQSVICLLYTSPSPRDVEESRMPSSA